MRGGSLPTAVDNNIVAVSATKRKIDSSTPEIFEVGSMLCRKNVVRKEDASMIQHPSDIGHGQCLLKAVVVDQHICCDHQVQALAGREVQSLSDDICVIGLHSRSVFRTDSQGAGHNPA